jgi:hypothetical protein
MCKFKKKVCQKGLGVKADIRVSGWLLFSAHGENKIIFNEMTMMQFVIDQHAAFDFYSASSLKKQSADRHVTQLWHIIRILRLPVFAACLVENQKIPIL